MATETTASATVDAAVDLDDHERTRGVTAEHPHRATPRDRTPLRQAQRVHRGSLLVFCVGIVVTSVLCVGARGVHNSNEDRLLRQRVREAAAVAAAAIGALQTPLASAAILAETTNGDATAFTALMKPTVTTGRPFVSASLWRLGGANLTPLAVVGAAPELQRQPRSVISSYLSRTTAAPGLSINDLLGSPNRRLGYGLTASAPGARYAVYAEAALPENRRAEIAANSAFSELDYALYLGDHARPSELLASSTGGAVTGSRQASDTVPFGDSHLLLVVAPRSELGGTLLEWLPWALGLLGFVLAGAATQLVERLIRRRERAETLADELDSVASENARLYNEQRSVARALQHALLPEALPDVGLELATRYVAGEADVEIGGDWYDIVPITDDRVLFVIGDVSGRGISAATVMASLRYSVRAYAVQGDAPDVILTKLGRLLSIKGDGHFATVLCGTIDLASRRLTVANAGHPSALLIDGGDAKYIDTHTGVPIGAIANPDYDATTITLPDNGTLLLYTDGLIERRGESLDAGFARLSRAATRTAGQSVEALLDTVVHELIPDGSSDDTALLGLRWSGRTDERTFANAPESIAAARRYVASIVDKIAPELTEPVSLMLSELATNCVRYEVSDFVVRVDADHGAIRIEVHDGGDGKPVMRAPQPHEPSGRGLRVVEAFADAWGVTETPGVAGKTVWFSVVPSAAQRAVSSS